jgi:hypothetical protein
MGTGIGTTNTINQISTSIEVMSSTTTAPPAQNLSNVSGSNILTSPHFSLTLGQVVNVLGTGWFMAENSSSQTPTVFNVHGQTFNVRSYAQANFSTSTGKYLSVEWVLLPNPASAVSYLNAKMQDYSNISPQSGMQGNANYRYYSGLTLNGGQEGGFLYAYDGPYMITMFSYGGNVFPLQQALELLSYQTQNLNVT